MALTGQLFDFLCAMDRATGVILYRWADWPGNPKLMPTDVDIVFLYHKGYSQEVIKESDFQDFNVIRTRKILTLRTKELTDVDLTRLKLNKLKCQKIAAWLNTLYLKMTASEGILPGIYGVKPGGFEEKLLQDSSKKIRDLAAEVIYEFHDRLWLAETEDEFLNIYNAARAKWLI